MSVSRTFARGHGAAALCLLLVIPLLAGAGAFSGSGQAATTGLVAAYSFDEGSGTSVADASGGGNNGTVANATWNTAGKFGGSLSFNGSSTMVSVPDAASLDLTTGMTLEAWVYPTSAPAWTTVIAKERAGGGFPYGLEAASGVPDSYGNTGSTSTAAATSALPLNAWSYLSSTYDGTTLRLYLNGTLVGSQAMSGSLTASSSPLRIGADSVWGEYFNGRIDNVRIYSRALSASELQTDMNTAVTVAAPPPPSSGPVVAFSFNEGTGTTVTDQSGSGNTGTVANAAWNTVGKYGGSLTFNGTNSLVSVADNASVDLAKAMTLEAWVYPSTGSGWASVIAKERAGGGFPYGLEMFDGTPDAYVNPSANATVTGATALPLNTWSFLSSTYDGSTLKLYVNGTLAASQAVTGSILASADPLRIGGDTVWNEYFAGRIDNVRVYSRALSASELTTDMNTPVGGTAPPPPPPAPGDTTPPSAPSGLTVSGITQTSVNLSWQASTDNVGVSGYGVYKNGTRLSNVTATAYTFSGLACGTTYTLGADAYDAAGNRSVTASKAATTAACSGGGGSPSVFVSPSGSDSNPCTSAAPCHSFDAAYQAAAAGAIVQVAGGTYGDQDIRYDSSKTSTADVVFQPAPGASVTIGGLTFGPTPAIKGASHVTVKDMTLHGGVAIYGCGAPAGSQCLSDSSSGGTYLTFQNLTVQDPYSFFCGSCGNIRILGGVWGPATYGSPCTGSAHPEVQNAYDSSMSSNRKLKRSHDILIDGAIFQNYSMCATGDHTECLQVEPADNVTIRHSIFRRCDTITVNFANDLAGDSVSAAGYAAPNNILIENNFFDEARSLVGDPTYYALNIRECTNCTVRYNSWTQPPRMPTGEISLNNVYKGNVGPYNSWECTPPGVTFSYNVWVGASCSPTDKNVSDPGFVDPSSNANLHLKAGSPAINAGDPNSAPPDDIDGQARPMGSAPDAGADEAG